MNKNNDAAKAVNNTETVETLETKVAKETTSSLDSLRAKYGGDMNIPGTKRYRGYGLTKGVLIEFQHPTANTFDWFHNVYETVDIPGTFRKEEKLRGFYLCTYMGKDEGGNPIHDELRFYDADYPMTFEQAAAECYRASEHNKANPNQTIEPKGPAKKLWHIGDENGFANPLDMLDSGTEIEYGQLAQTYYYNGIEKSRRIVVSADYYRSNPSYNTNSNSNRTNGTFANRLASANKNSIKVNY
jgi:hypothetical protein